LLFGKQMVTADREILVANLDPAPDMESRSVRAARNLQLAAG
jgi:hypothetical protein